MFLRERTTLPSVSLHYSPLADGPAELYYRESGSGLPLVFLHGGWGYDIYPLERQRQAIKDFRLLAPDRSGYGQSSKPARFGTDLHRRAAEETLLLLDALNVRQAIFWGHSDGAVTAVMLGLTVPDRCLGIILEALHYDREKPASRGFFQSMVSEPESFGTRVAEVLRKEHGDPYWRELLRSEGRTWLDLARSTNGGRRDLFDGQLSKLRVPTVILHGAQDPRTESWELDEVRRELPQAEMHVIAAGGHSPHSEREAAAEFGRLLQETLRKWSHLQDPSFSRQLK
jgi:pimeloyl-ACP methyl ester carboxylesterase